MSAVGDPLGPDQEEMVAALPSQVEREELVVFIQTHLRPGFGNETSRGFSLFMKAYRLLLERQLARFRQEFYQPTTEAMLRLEKSLALQEETQRAGIASMERSATHAEDASQRTEKTVPKIEKAVQTAFDGYDPKILSQRITESFEKSMVEPLEKTNEKLNATLEVFQEVLLHAEQAIKILRRVSFPSIAGVTFMLALLLCGSLSAYIIGRMGTAYDRKLAAAVENNGDAFAQLAQLHARIQVVPQGDQQGNPIPGHYALSLENADAAQVKTKDPQRRGVIFFQKSDDNN
jgi:hypothetical protein